ncbi:uncharacterized protein CIMG_13294 [Coccidioides immitis RS]|uniref:Uncharacterized protein n=1 Tax=Coccidioides immitis (strain RS) TaxID=246410 RepID=A0A0D8JVB7_COCIM|nr:uncharacterized protein CIMG_13294 [Coccidioides immitis RS]KJF60876.1 hypothetical protein CIMG_13294 [Coccidioides immitis RS]
MVRIAKPALYTNAATAAAKSKEARMHLVDSPRPSRQYGVSSIQPHSYEWKLSSKTGIQHPRGVRKFHVAAPWQMSTDAVHACQATKNALQGS